MQRDPAIVPSQSDDGIVQCVHCPDRRGGATPRQYALLLRPLKVARLLEWEELSSECDGFYVFAFHPLRFLFYDPSSPLEPEPKLF